VVSNPAWAGGLFNLDPDEEDISAARSRWCFGSATTNRRDAVVVLLGMRACTRGAPGESYDDKNGKVVDSDDVKSGSGSTVMAELSVSNGAEERRNRSRGHSKCQKANPQLKYDSSHVI
jgi:hypothetical protein